MSFLSIIFILLLGNLFLSTDSSNAKKHAKPIARSLEKENDQFVVQSSKKGQAETLLPVTESLASEIHHKDVYLRAIYLFFLFLPVTIASIPAFFSLRFREVCWFKLLQLTIAYSGAAFIKWGQWASTRTDMFPESLCETLANLQDHAPIHSFAFTKNEIEKAFNQPLTTLFSEFDPVPIASGSIAQVHRAVWNGHQVAVKVRHPNVKEQIALDFIIMAVVAKLLDSFHSLSWLRLTESVAQFSDKIAAQTNLNLEAEQLANFNQRFKNWEFVDFPVPYLSRENVIIESFLPGSNVANIIKTKRKETLESLDAGYFVVTKGEEIYLKMLILDNFMHADLHSGNILFYSKEEKISQTRQKLGLVDAGMVAILSPEQQKNFIGLLEAVGEGNGHEAADCILHFSDIPVTTKTISNFRKDMSLTFQKVAKGYGYNVDIGLVLREVLKLLKKHKITIEANYATLLMNMLCLDGMARRMFPSYNVLDGAKPLLRFHRRIKNLPVFIREIVKKLSLPVLLWYKRWSDEKFLKEEKALLLKKSELYSGFIN